MKWRIIAYKELKLGGGLGLELRKKKSFKRDECIDYSIKPPRLCPLKNTNRFKVA